MKTMAAGDVYEWVEDYSAEMAATSPADTISESTWTVSGFTAGTNDNTSSTTTQWLTALTNYTYASATNTIRTAAGRIYNKTLEFDISPQVCE
jgi:hypothetical protein